MALQLRLKGGVRQSQQKFASHCSAQYFWTGLQKV